MIIKKRQKDLIRLIRASVNRTNRLPSLILQSSSWPRRVIISITNRLSDLWKTLAYRSMASSFTLKRLTKRFPIATDIVMLVLHCIPSLSMFLHLHAKALDVKWSSKQLVWQRDTIVFAFFPPCLFSPWSVATSFQIGASSELWRAGKLFELSFDVDRWINERSIWNAK